MAANYKIVTNKKAVEHALTGQTTKRYADKIGFKLVAIAKSNTKIITGRLASSWSHRVDEKGNIFVGSGVGMAVEPVIYAAAYLYGRAGSVRGGPSWVSKITTSMFGRKDDGGSWKGNNVWIIAFDHMKADIASYKGVK